MTAQRQPNPSADFMADAACKGKGELFVPGTSAGAVLHEVRVICEGCPVRVPCGAYADVMDPAGVWSGLSQKQRRRARKRPA